MTNQFSIHDTAQQAAVACGQTIAVALQQAVQERGVARLAISGGSTPGPMFAHLAQAGLDWTRIRLFWVDERNVPPDHEQSNYRLARHTLIEPAAIPPENVLRMEGELDAAEAARRYAAHFMPDHVLDVIHLGMGGDAHTASLFPGVPEIDDRDALVGAPWVAKLNTHRITLMPKVLLAARQVLFLAAGADKVPALQSVLHAEYRPQDFPSQLVARQHPAVTWYLDRLAAPGV